MSTGISAELLRQRLQELLDEADTLQGQAQDVKADIGDLVDELSDLQSQLEHGEQRKAALRSASRAELEAALAALDQTDVLTAPV